MGDGAYMFANPTVCHQVAEALGLPVIVVVLNNDAVVTEGWLTALQAALGRDPGVGVVGGGDDDHVDRRIVEQLLDPGARVLEYGAIPLLMTAALADLDYEVSALDVRPERFAQAIGLAFTASASRM